jgi:hypothetical protein
MTTPDTPIHWLAWIMEDDTKHQRGYHACRKATEKRVGKMHICGALACLTVLELERDGAEVTVPVLRARAGHRIDHPILKRLIADGLMESRKLPGGKLAFSLTVIGASRSVMVDVALTAMIDKFKVVEVLKTT